MPLIVLKVTCSTKSTKRLKIKNATNSMYKCFLQSLIEGIFVYMEIFGSFYLEFWASNEKIMESLVLEAFLASSSKNDL